MRTKHWIKNLLVFLPCFFNKTLTVSNALVLLLGALAFSFVSSSIYCVNDIFDYKKDRLHDIKRNRPIASGRISRKAAIALAAVLLILGLAIDLAFSMNKSHSVLLLLAYFVMNVAYSYKLKNYPIVDISILSLGFVFRVLYGGVLTDVQVSSMLALSVMIYSMYMALGKRRNEKQIMSDKSRQVLKDYPVQYLDKCMYMCMAVGLVFYSIWAISIDESMIITVFFVLIISLRYSLVLEGNNFGDPVDVLLNDKILMILVLIYCVTVISIYMRL